MDKVNVKQLTKAGLKELCDKYGLTASGNKSALQKRVSGYLNTHSPNDESKTVPPKDDVEVREHSDEDEIQPDDSASNRGSTTSSVCSKRALNIARLKSLQVQKDALEKQQQLKQKLFEQEEKARRERETLNAELERAQLETQMNMLMAEETAFAEFDAAKEASPRKMGYKPPVSLQEFLHAASKSDAGNGNKHEPQRADGATIETLNQEKSTNQAAPTQPDKEVPASSVLLQQQMLDLLTLPKPQLMTFDGNPLNFHMFLNVFDSCIHVANISDAAKLNRTSNAVLSCPPGMDGILK